MRTLLLALSLLILPSFPLLVAQPRAAASAAPAPAPVPGKLALPLTVTERGRVTRIGQVVTSGVPFPRGFLPDPGRLTVLDSGGQPLPTQVSVMSRWWKPGHDGSVRWARVSFPCDVIAGRRAVYTLVDRPLTAAERARLGGLAVSVEDRGDSWSVSTGIARFAVPKKGARLLSSAEVGGTELLRGNGLRVLLSGGDWPEQGMKRGALHIGIHDAVEVEERGPVRAVLALRGTFRGGGEGAFKGDLYDFTARLYFDRGSSRVRLVHTLVNGRVGETLRIWPIEDLSLIGELALGAEPGALLLGEKDAVPVTFGDATRVASLYQDSSGGAEWKELTSKKNYAAWLAPFTKTPPEEKDRRRARYFVKGASFPGYEIRTDKEVLEHGARARGVVLATGQDGAVLAAMRHFRVRCPAGFTVSAGAIRAALWPGEYEDALFLETGQRFTRELTFDFRLEGGSSDDLRQAHALLDRRLLFTAPPDWYVQSGGWDAGLAAVRRTTAPGRQKTGAPTRHGLDKDALDGIDVGWDWFGWIKGFNSGGLHWNQSTCLADFVLWADHHAFDLAEARALWAADNALVHFGPVDMPRFWRAIRIQYYHQWRHFGIKHETFPGWVYRPVWQRPDDGHLGMFMWFEYYNLTGDRRVLESCLALGQVARAFMWGWTHDDTRTGGVGGNAEPWVKRRDPDGPEPFRLHNRYQGWPLYTLALVYQLTGDPQIADEARIVAGGLRNTARWAPQGFLTTQINEAGNGEIYGKQLSTGPTPTDSASQCYAHFQYGVCATALVQYYRETGDEEALDALIGIADFAVHHGLVRDRHGKPHGWSYVFGDYWGPYRLEEFSSKRNSRPNWTVTNFRVVQPLGWTYMLTGRTDYLEILKAALAGVPESRLSVLAARQALTTPRADVTPPAAVVDLAAEPLGDGRVRLSWTAPGDDGMRGTAARYQVKHSTSPIVEQISGWPDRTPPLPKTRAEWEARAAAFNARQRAFWSTWNAKGEPPPGASGSKESFEVSGLKPGVRYFALKTWDDGPNMSVLSNVARVEVR